MNTILWERESELALRAVALAAQHLQDSQGRSVVSTKESFRDVVTEADRTVSRMIEGTLAASGLAILDEEASAAATRLPSGSAFWAVDPIDGTANFASGLPFYGSSIGLCRGNDFLTGAVALPQMRELFFTHGDRGAFLNGKALQISDASLENCLLASSFSGTSSDRTQRALQFEAFGALNEASRGALRLGSAATNLCFLAAGRLQVAYGFHAQVWDVAGGLAVAQQAGCVLRTGWLSGTTRLHYIAGAPTAVSQAESILKRLGLMPEGGWT